MENRTILFEKILNVRDLGGLQTASGHAISSGLLFRSASLADATEADQRKLRARCRIAKIIDFTGTDPKVSRLCALLSHIG